MILSKTMIEQKHVREGVNKNRTEEEGHTLIIRLTNKGVKLVYFSQWEEKLQNGVGENWLKQNAIG